MAKIRTGTLEIGGRVVNLEGNVLDAATLLANHRERLNAMTHGTIEITFSPLDMKVLPREKIADERREKLELR